MDFLEQIVTQLTGERPRLEVEEDDHGAIINMHITGNISLLIGKNGSTIDAVRILLKAIGYNGKHRIKLRIHEQVANPQPSTG